MSSPEHRPILLLGSYGRGNIGDDAFLEAALQHLPSDVPLYLNSAHDELLPPDMLARVQTIATIDYRDFRKKVKVFRHVKHIVYCGGDLWVELYGERFPRASLYKMLGTNIAARLMRKQVHYLGCGIGNLAGWSLFLARWSARLANTVIVREPRSAKVLGMRRAVILPDLASSLGWPATPARTEPGKPFTIGISILYHLPNPEQTFPALLQTLSSFVASLPAGKFRVVLLPMLVSPTDPKDDLWASRQLQVALENCCGDVTIASARSVGDFVREVSQMDLVIGARLHANIFALLSGTPALGISYRPKVASFFTSNRLQKYCIDLTKLGGEELAEAFWNIYENYPQVAAEFAAARDRMIQEGAGYQTFISRHF